MGTVEPLSLLLETAVAGSAAILVVMAVRRPLRHVFGAAAAYAAWALVPLAMLAVLLPAASASPSAMRAFAVAAVRVDAVQAVARDQGLADTLFGSWLVGTAVCVAWLAAQQYRFRRGLGRLRARADGSVQSTAVAGLPAAIGLWRPQVVVPADFDVRYDDAQRAVMLAHERGHIAHGDLHLNALAAALRCLFWFNPLLHVAARHFRHDQELACDQRVVARHPQHRRAYAEAMLQVQLAAQPLPLGCHWGYSHPLKERIEMLKRPVPPIARRIGGMSFVAAFVCCASFTAWALQPVRPEPSRVQPPAAVQSNTAPESTLPAPAYPPEALQAGISGQVVLLVDIDERGVPTRVEVERSEPAGVFDETSVAMARQWRFAPETENGRAVPGRVRVPVTFDATRKQDGTPKAGGGLAQRDPVAPTAG